MVAAAIKPVRHVLPFAVFFELSSMIRHIAVRKVYSGVQHSSIAGLILVELVSIDSTPTLDLCLILECQITFYAIRLTVHLRIVRYGDPTTCTLPAAANLASPYCYIGIAGNIDRTVSSSNALLRLHGGIVGNVDDAVLASVVFVTASDASFSIYLSVIRNRDFFILAGRLSNITAPDITVIINLLDIYLCISGDLNFRGAFAIIVKIFVVAINTARNIHHRIAGDLDAGGIASIAANRTLHCKGAVVDLNIFGACSAIYAGVTFSTDGYASAALFYGELLVCILRRDGELAGADIVILLDGSTSILAGEQVIALHRDLHIALALNINGCRATDRCICHIGLVDGGILQRQLDQLFCRVGEDLDDAKALTFLAAAAGRSLAGAIGGVIRGVVRGAGGSHGRGLGLWLGLTLVLCFGLLPLASGSIQLPVCRGILLLLFLVIGVAVVILIFGLGLLLRVSRSFGILLLLLFLSSGGVLCLRGLLRGLLLGRSLGRSHRLVFFLPVLLSGLRSSISGAIAAGNHDFLIGAVCRRCSVVPLHGDAAFTCRDHKAAIGKIKGGRKCRGGKGYRHAQGHGRRRDLPEQFFSSHDFYLPFCILWLFCQIYHTPPPTSCAI